MEERSAAWRKRWLELPQAPEGPRRRFKATVAYDGTDHNGWQSQPEGTTIQDTIERRLTSYLKRKIRIHAAGRTDAGVHARAQVFHFDLVSCELECPPSSEKKTTRRKKNPVREQEKSSHQQAENKINNNTMGKYDKKLTKILKTGLPSSIAIRAVEEVPLSFHARESCTRKRYCYTICEDFANPFHARFCWSLGCTRQLDVALMQEAANKLVGEHDFSAFSVMLEGDERNPVQRMHSLEVTRIPAPGVCDSNSLVTITAECTRYMYKMMRMISGTLCQVGAGRCTPQDIERMLLSNKHTKELFTAPPEGLCLHKVCYDNDS